MENYVRISFISIFSLFLLFKHHVLILPVSQLQTQQVMTSLFRLHIGLSYSCAHFVVEID